MSEVSVSRRRDDSDARAWFYLDHRRDIETWAELAGDGRYLLHRCLLELGPRVEQLAAQLEALPYEADTDGGDRPRFGLRHASWATRQGSPTAVTVEWQFSALLGVGRGDHWPFVAVRSDDPADAAKLADLLLATRLKLRGHSSGVWPFWRYIRVAGEAVDPDALMDDLMSGLQNLWHQAQPVLDGFYTGAGAFRPAGDVPAP